MNDFSLRLKQLPQDPGVYLFKNRQGNVLYVGKAKSLKPRVTSYFRLQADLSESKRIMLQQIETIDWIVVKTEVDALVLEDKLIKDYQPRFNILAKDDKALLYLHITTEAFPRVLAVRRPDLSLGGIFYGPYPFARSVRNFIELLHTIFPFRTCRTLPKRPCLEYYLGRCQAPCIKGVSQLEYHAMINDLIDCVEGKPKVLITRLQQDMERAALAQQFERAARLRDQLQAIQRLQDLRKTPQQYLAEYYKTTNLDPQRGLAELTRILHLPQPPHRIEVYDISNVQGTFSVASMIVFEDGLPAKSEYRRFKIKTVTGPNDFASLHEVVQRRLKRNWSLPDLAIMDGGKGQLSSVAALWQAAGVRVISLAKRREEIFQPDVDLPLRLAPGSQGLFLIQRMRDEAHRFAITYYRLLHKKSYTAGAGGKTVKSTKAPAAMRSALGT